MSGLYCTLAEATEYCRTSIVADGPQVEAALIAACQSIDQWCQTDFSVPSSATLRPFVAPRCSDLLRVPPISSTSGLIVVDDGKTLTIGTDFQLEVSPGNASSVTRTGETRPYHYVRLLGEWWSYDNAEALADITARWGWLAIPAPVKVAAKLLTRDYFTSRDTTFGVQSFGVDGFTRRIGSNSQVVNMLAPYRELEAIGIA